jgi:hypothetical protein
MQSRRRFVLTVAGIGGFEVTSRRRGRRNSSKYVWFDEVADFYVSGKSVLVYQHFPRENRDRYLRRRSEELQAHCPRSRIVALKTSYVAFFLAVHPDHKSLGLEKRVERLQQLGLRIFDAGSS